jgi:hypothetical protein
MACRLLFLLSGQLDFDERHEAYYLIPHLEQKAPAAWRGFSRHTVALPVEPWRRQLFDDEVNDQADLGNGTKPLKRTSSTYRLNTPSHLRSSVDNVKVANDPFVRPDRETESTKRSKDQYPRTSLGTGMIPPVVPPTGTGVS